MQIGISSYSYHEEFAGERLELFDWMTLCAKDLKVNGVEIFEPHLKSHDEDYLKAVKRVALDLQLTIAGLAMDTDFGHTEEEALSKELENVERALSAARQLGAPQLRITTGRPEENSRHKQWKEMARCVEIATLLGDREGTVVAIENNGRSGFLLDADDVHRLMHDTDSQWLRLALNPAGYEDGIESVQKTMVYAVHVRAAMGQVAPDGHDPAVDYPALFRLLRELNYRGFVTLAYEGGEPGPDAAPRALEFLRALARA